MEYSKKDWSVMNVASVVSAVCGIIAGFYVSSQNIGFWLSFIVITLAWAIPGLIIGLAFMGFRKTFGLAPTSFHLPILNTVAGVLNKYWPITYPVMVVGTTLMIMLIVNMSLGIITNINSILGH